MIETQHPAESFGALDRVDYRSCMFTGHERDEETGLDYMLARYYSSSVARFLSVDPASQSITSIAAQSWNRYSYVRNDPLRFVDPTGMLEVDSDTAKRYPKAATHIENMRPTDKKYQAFASSVGASRSEVRRRVPARQGPYS